ncbi:MAG TPA: type II toxin-antitoxin system antitoxin SocA domain-containing protein [Chitinophagaceae bacterium]|nr:type II toxin-antitoxin system antitoxin SocA domain-containing protein [Chitinophagaceae bacterium]
MSYAASAIAYAFTIKGIEEGKFVTQMKLQKMVFFAHGYHLAKYGSPLINETFEAWRFGPVVPDIYQSYKLYGSDMIIDPGLVRNSAKPLTFSEPALDAIEYTWKVTKNFSASQLSSWSHLSDSPWAAVYDPANDSSIIQNESIKEYFQKLLFTAAA